MSLSLLLVVVVVGCCCSSGGTVGCVERYHRNVQKMSHGVMCQTRKLDVRCTFTQNDDVAKQIVS